MMEKTAKPGKGGLLLLCKLQLTRQIHSPYFYSAPICALWSILVSRWMVADSKRNAKIDREIGKMYRIKRKISCCNKMLQLLEECYYQLYLLRFFGNAFYTYKLVIQKKVYHLPSWRKRKYPWHENIQLLNRTRFTWRQKNTYLGTLVFFSDLFLYNFWGRKVCIVFTVRVFLVLQILHSCKLTKQM